MSNTDLISIEKIKEAIYLIRGEKVMLDRDLAHLYQGRLGKLRKTSKRGVSERGNAN